MPSLIISYPIFTENGNEKPLYAIKEITFDLEETDQTVY